MMHRISLCLLALTLAGCYSYQPIQVGASPRLAERVVLDLTPEGTVEMARYLGPRVTTAEGVLMTIGDDGAMNVAVDFVEMADRTKQPWAGEGSVVFPREYVQVVRERHFEKRRTVIASTAAIGALLAAAIITMKQTGVFGGDGSGGTSPPP